MKKSIISLMLIALLGFAAAQSFVTPFPEEKSNMVAGGLGMTWIDGQPYTTITIAPDLSFGKIGVGLNLQFLMDNNNKLKLRQDEYKGGAGVLRAIRYIRYGFKNDKYYGRFGTLDAAVLGHGFLMWNYNNASNYDKRKLGLALDLDFDKFGFESVVSNLGHKELMGARFYVRPVKYFNPDLFFVKNLRFGVTVVKDYNLNSWETDSTKQDFSAYGFDVDIPLFKLDWAQSFIYFDYAKFNDYGSGKAVGINFLLPKFVGLLSFSASYERRWLGKQFIPNFFGPLYDLQREMDPFSYGEQSIFNQLKNLDKSTKGYFGQLAAVVAGKIRVIGNYQKLDDDPNSGMFHAEAQVPDLIPKFKFYAYYDKRNIKTFKDLRTLDFNSLATVEVGYMMNQFIMVSTLYRWYWVEQNDGSFKPIERVEPRISFVYNF